MYGGAKDDDRLEIAVEVERNGGTLVARIEDNGRHIRSDPSPTPPRWRLRSQMRKSAMSAIHLSAQLCQRHGLRTSGRPQSADAAVHRTGGDRAIGVTPMTGGVRVRIIPPVAARRELIGPRRARYDRPARLRHPAAAGEPPRPAGDQGRADGRGLAGSRGGRKQYSGPRLGAAQGARQRRATASATCSLSPGRGYRFVAPVECESAVAAAARPRRPRRRARPSRGQQQPSAAADRLNRTRSRARRDQGAP